MQPETWHTEITANEKKLKMQPETLSPQSKDKNEKKLAMQPGAPNTNKEIKFEKATGGQIQGPHLGPGAQNVKNNRKPKSKIEPATWNSATGGQIQGQNPSTAAGGQIQGQNCTRPGAQEALKKNTKKLHNSTWCLKPKKQRNRKEKEKTMKLKPGTWSQNSKENKRDGK